MKIREIARLFGIDQDFAPAGNGHINDTYRSADGQYILQRVNTHVFTRPVELMENIEAVTEFIAAKLRETGGDPSRETLKVLHTEDGRSYIEDEDGFFRMYLNITDSYTVEPEDAGPAELTEAGAAFGRFQELLDDYDAAKLHETIPFFHDTENRLKNFRAALEKNSAGRAESVKAETEFVLSHAWIASVVLDGIRDGSIPLCVTHNDTKINNVLFDVNTHKAICVIDLDTIMPGSRLYDFGDALRISASTAAEDEPDLTKVHFDPEAFKAFARGYLSEVGSTLTPREKELLPFSALLMCYECGTRFLTDYLEGDVYFKVKYPEHNLVRCRTQFRMAEEILAAEEGLKAWVAASSDGSAEG